MDNQHRRSARLRRSTRLSILSACAFTLLGCGDGGGGSTGPTAAAGCSYVDLNTAITATLNGSDPSGQAVTYEIVSSPSNGSVTLTDPLAGRFSYTPNTNARGVDSFTFRVHNGESHSNTATYQLVYVPRIMPLGDSITEGTMAGGDPPPAQRISYRKKLYEDLTAASYRVDLVGSLSNGTEAGIGDPDHEGHPGWCDDSPCSRPTIDTHIVDMLNSERPDVVLLHIGTNDFSTDASGVNSILDQISAWAQSNQPVQVFLARIIPTLTGSLDVSTFNDNVQGIATDRPGMQIFVVDQQAELRSASDPNVARSTLMADDLHPNQAGYDRMASRWRERILSADVLSRCP